MNSTALRPHRKNDATLVLGLWMASLLCARECLLIFLPLANRGRRPTHSRFSPLLAHAACQCCSWWKRWLSELRWERPGQCRRRWHHPLPPKQGWGPPSPTITEGGLSDAAARVALNTVPIEGSLLLLMNLCLPQHLQPLCGHSCPEHRGRADEVAKCRHFKGSPKPQGYRVQSVNGGKDKDHVMPARPCHSTHMYEEHWGSQEALQQEMERWPHCVPDPVRPLGLAFLVCDVVRRRELRLQDSSARSCILQFSNSQGM